MLGECLERMQEIETGSVDMVMADLPYGTTACKWDAVIPFAPLWEQYRRVCKKNAAIVLTASQPFTSALVMSNPAMFRYELIWEKSKATGHLDAQRKPMKAHESICVFSTSPTIYNPQKTAGKPYTPHAGKKVTEVYGAVANQNHRNDHKGMRFPRSVLYFKTAEQEPGKTTHPTQKPVALMEYLIRTYTNEGETVLDNTMGSGTTGVACINTGRNFIGIERDPEYFKIAQGRCDTLADIW